jgi:prepilin-type N-terminal cleavage/methylation domain-containing protein
MATPRRRDGGEPGFTIVELMVTSAILLLIVTATMAVLVAAQRATGFSTRRGQTHDEVRLAMDRLTKDLRQTTRFNTTFTASGSGS